MKLKDKLKKPSKKEFNRIINEIKENLYLLKESGRELHKELLEIAKLMEIKGIEKYEN